ncbi:MAG: hypothetical protein RI906_801 [Pseudomonadota bacterium]|jgi:hypothetical protein
MINCLRVRRHRLIDGHCVLALIAYNLTYLLSFRFGIMKYRRLAFCSLIPVMFSACSDGVGGGGPGAKGRDSSVTVSGTVIDGYVVGAKLFCLDANGNEVKKDPIGVSGADGRFSAKMANVSECAVIEARGGTDVGLGSGSSALPDSTRFRLRLAGRDTIAVLTQGWVVSPLTTLANDMVQAGLSSTDARARVNTFFGLNTTLDPATVDPIKAGDMALFRAGVQVAAVTQEMTAAINAALLKLDSSVSQGAQAVVYQSVARALADAIRLGGIQARDLGSAAELEAVAAIAIDSVKKSPSRPSVSSNLSTDVLKVAAATLGARVGKAVDVTSSLDTIAASVASSKLNKWIAEDIVEELRKANLLTVSTLSTTDLLSVRAALTALAAAAANQAVEVKWPGIAPQDPPKPLASAFKVKSDVIRIFSKSGFEDVALSKFEAGTSDTRDGLRGVSFVLEVVDQPVGQVPEVPSPIKLGFSIESTVPDEFVAHAIVDKVNLRWINGGLALEVPAEATLAGDLYGDALSLSNSAGAISKLISSNAGELKIDLVALASASNVSAATLDSLIGSGTFTVAATLSDIKLVRLKAGQLERLPTLSVSAAGTTVTGATFKGSIKIQ